MKLTFVDAGVLIAAARGSDEAAERAMEVLDDPTREFASSTFVQLEVLPKALYRNDQYEVDFYDTFFRSVTHWAQPIDGVVTTAHEEGAKWGLSAVDALHVAGAKFLEANELVTTERREKPLHRATSVRVFTIHSGTKGWRGE